LKLEVVPLLADQELMTSKSTRVTYWEGAVRVKGTYKGRSVEGKGYVELTGYDKRFRPRF
ncbi:MAG: lipocalin family protein, partial [Pseudomonadota bacterium]